MTGCRRVMWRIGEGTYSLTSMHVAYRWSISVTEHITCMQSVTNVQYSIEKSVPLRTSGTRSKWLDVVQQPHRKRLVWTHCVEGCNLTPEAEIASASCSKCAWPPWRYWRLRRGRPQLDCGLTPGSHPTGVVRWCGYCMQAILRLTLR